MNAIPSFYSAIPRLHFGDEPDYLNLCLIHRVHLSVRAFVRIHYLPIPERDFAYCYGRQSDGLKILTAGSSAKALGRKAEPAAPVIHARRPAIAK